MPDLKVFLSVGATSTDKQESFIRAVEDRLRAEGISPHTVGRNTFSADSPLKAITDLMNESSGAVVIAFERKYFSSGVELRGGPRETALNDIKLTLESNRGRNGLFPQPTVNGDRGGGASYRRPAGARLRLVRATRATRHHVPQHQRFNGILASWKNKMTTKPLATRPAASDLTIVQLLGTLKLSQLWSVLAALAGLVAGAVTVGAKLLGAH